jgi:hypothetical protein
MLSIFVKRLPSPGPVVIKKDDEPLLNREGRVLCVHKRGIWSPLSKNTGFDAYSMNKTGGRRKMFITRANAAS